MSDDLTARLRDFADPHDRHRATVDAVPHELLRKAADRIEELTAVVRLLETERDMWKARVDGLLAELARVLHDTGLIHTEEAEADG